MITISIVIFAVQDSALVFLTERAPDSSIIKLPELQLQSALDLDHQIDKYLVRLFPDTPIYRKQIRAFSVSESIQAQTTIRIGYYAMVQANHLAQPFEETHTWIPLKNNQLLNPLDLEILQAAHRRLLAKMSSQLAGFELIPEQFTLKQLQELYETILGHTLDKRNFRRKILRFDVIRETGKHLHPWNESGKAPMLYRLERQQYDSVRNAGGNFNLS